MNVNRALRGNDRSGAAVGIEVSGHWQAGLRPTESSYGAMVYMASILTGQIVFAIVVMTLFTLARHATGRLDAAKAVGEKLAEKAKAAGIERVVFDRGGRLFHGRVAAVAEGAREKGLQI